MRGTQCETLVSVAYAGIIPAYAGNTTVSYGDALLQRDHPRVCGEHIMANIAASIPQGSSPRMRGTRAIAFATSLLVRIIPAYAGNTKDLRPSYVGWRDHPRVCGEHSSIAWAISMRPGSSPRMRGTRRTCARRMSAGGIIPAYAGNTRRLRGQSP